LKKNITKKTTRGNNIAIHSVLKKKNYKANVLTSLILKKIDKNNFMKKIKKIMKKKTKKVVEKKNYIITYKKNYNIFPTRFKVLLNRIIKDLF
jgi:hypothetical protein